MNLIDTANPLLVSYSFYAALLTIKLVLMSGLTSFFRLKNKVFANPEESGFFKTKVITNNPDVERVRRAHLNDLENIPAFWVLGFLYLLTNPCPTVALLCFRIFTAARFGHTVAYLLKIFQLRGPLFIVGLVINLYMGFNVLLYSF